MVLILNPNTKEATTTNLSEFQLFIGNRHHNTSSKSYTVLIFPDNTLINTGLCEFMCIAVGLESSTSELYSIGFMENKDF